MANNHEASQIVTNEILRIAHNASAFVSNVNTDHDDKWTGKYAPGNTINVRGPVQFTTRTGETASVQDVNEWTTPVTLEPLLGIDFALNLTDMVTAIGPNGVINERFRKRYLQPAGMKIAAMIDYEIGVKMKNGFHQFVGTPGTGPSTVADILACGVPLDDMSVPRDGQRMAALEPSANASIVAGLSGLFNDKGLISEQNRTGVLRTGLGLDFVMSQNVPSHTVGALGGTPLVAGANQGTINSGATDNPRAATTTLAIDGASNSVTGWAKKGDVITIAGVFSVNPETKQSTGKLQQFVVTADADSSGTGTVSLVISPAIIAGGAYQNVSARPADNAAVSVVTGTAGATYRNNIAWHPDAFVLVSPEQSLPQGMAVASRSTLPDGGLSLRWVQGYDITNNRNINRLDVLWGGSVVLPNFGVRRTS